MLLVCAMIKRVGLTVSSQKFRSTVKFSLGTVHRQSKQVKTWDKQCTGNVNFRLLLFLLPKGILMFWQFKTSTFYTIWNSPWLALFCCRSSPVQRPMHCKRKCWLVEFGWQQYAYALQKISECSLWIGYIFVWNIYGALMCSIRDKTLVWERSWVCLWHSTLCLLTKSILWMLMIISWDLFKGMITILVYYNRYIYRYKYIDIY